MARSSMLRFGARRSQRIVPDWPDCPFSPTGLRDVLPPFPSK
jgi:hypothetical protein